MRIAYNVIPVDWAISPAEFRMENSRLGQPRSQQFQFVSLSRGLAHFEQKSLCNQHLTQAG